MDRHRPPREHTIDALGREITYGYDAGGRLAEVTDPQGGTTRYAYDADGRRISATTPAGLVTRYRYDPAGRVSPRSTRVAGSPATSTTPRGQQTAVISPSGAITRVPATTPPGS